MEKEELKKLLKHLPRGYAKKIVEQTGHSYPTVYNTINGKAHNKEVINAAIELALKEKEEKERNKEILATL
jgi:hypothetical protein